MLILAMLLATGDPRCDPNGNQIELNVCAAQDFAKADKALNTAWPRALAMARRTGGANRLLVAQRTWLAFRDAECDAESAGSTGGSMHGMAIAGCRTQLTEQRTRQLIGITKGN